MDFSKIKSNKPKCVDCGEPLNTNDYVCCLDPYSDTTAGDAVVRINLCIKCYATRKNNMGKVIRGEMNPEELEPEQCTVDITLDREPSKKKRKKRKAEQVRRRSVMKKYKQEEDEELV